MTAYKLLQTFLGQPKYELLIYELCPYICFWVYVLMAYLMTMSAFQTGLC